MASTYTKRFLGNRILQWLLACSNCFKKLGIMFRLWSFFLFSVTSTKHGSPKLDYLYTVLYILIPLTLYLWEATLMVFLFYRCYKCRGLRKPTIHILPSLIHDLSIKDSVFKHKFNVEFCISRLFSCRTSFFSETTVLWNCFPPSIFQLQYYNLIN